MATLTIADLDNGKRDLQTVDEVANSRAVAATTRFGQQTTTLYESIRRINATGDEILSNLGFRVPVPYASGLNVTDSRFTVTGPDGNVYAPLSAPFTTGAWDPSQWYVLQNDLSDHKLLIFDTLLVAQAAATVLPDEQEVWARDVLTRYVVAAGALQVTGHFEDFTAKVAQPEYFGATGDDADKDTAAFKAMFAAAAEGKFNCYQPDPAKRYKIKEDLDLGPTSQWLTDLNIEATAPDSGQHTPLIKIEGWHSLKNVDIKIPSGFSHRGILRNDFYNDSSKPLSSRKITIGDIRIVSDDVISGYTGDGASCVMFGFSESITIGNIHIDGFDRAVNISDSNFVTLGNKEIRRMVRGVQLTRINDINDAGGSTYGKATYTMGAGANGLVIRGSINGKIGKYFIYDPDEHGVRFTAETVSGQPTVGGNLSMDDVTVIRPGGCAVKVASGSESGDSSDIIVNCAMGHIFSEDVGSAVYRTDPGPSPAGGNHFGFNIQYVKGLRVAGFETKKVLNAYSGTYGIMSRRGSEVHIGYVSIKDTHNSGVFINNDAVAEDFYIYNGEIINCGNGAGTQAVTLLNPANINRLTINTRIQSCPAVVAFGSTGTPGGPIVIRGDRFSVPLAIKGSAPTSRLIVDVREIGWPNSSGLEYPLGTTLLCLGGGSVPARNSGVGVYLSTTSSQRFIATNSDAGSSGDVMGSPLLGSWVVVGAIAGAQNVLVRRVS